MNGTRFEHRLVVSNVEGLHLRPATAFAELARLFQSQVTVYKNGKGVDGKSPLDMMLLAAEQGTELVLEVSGTDAERALTTLLQLLTSLGVIHDPDESAPPKG